MEKSGSKRPRIIGSKTKIRAALTGGPAPAGAAEIPLKDDLLFGAKAIADYIGLDERKVFYWIERGYIPVIRAESG